MGEQLQQLAVPYLITFGIALLVSVLVGPVLIPFLHKLKFGQEIREEGPSWHKKKSGTPTMGGFIFIAGGCVAAGGQQQPCCVFSCTDGRLSWLFNL